MKPYEGLWQDEARMSGDVCLRGTRIPADIIAGYLDEIAAHYPYVTLEHLVSAWHWNADGRPDDLQEKLAVWSVPTGDLMYRSIWTAEDHVLLRVERRMI